MLEHRDEIGPSEQVVGAIGGKSGTHGIRADIDLPVGANEVQAGLEVGTSENGKPLLHAVGLARQILKAAIAVDAADAADTPKTETTFAVVHDDGAEFAHYVQPE